MREEGCHLKRRLNSSTDYPFETNTSNSTKQGQFALEWLLDPIGTDAFFPEIFEKDPKLVHNDSSKFRSLITLSHIQNIVLAGQLRYGIDIDVTRYSVSNGRSTLNGSRDSPVGEEAWGQFRTGASLRLLRPQVQAEGIYRLCAHLEGFLECIVGANVYVTPVDCQGFAPHFDDIDAFICQVSGRKRWRVYKPRTDGLDLLPRHSSVDFSRDEMKDTDLAIDAVLEPGDMLYLPRGTIHEARCVQGKDENQKDRDSPSVHVTISMFQKWTWADLLAESASMAIRSAANQDLHLRRTLPLRFGRFSGAAHTGLSEDKREWFHEKVGKMLQRVAHKFPTDAAADALAARFMRERLPPVLTKGKPSSGKIGLNCFVRAVVDNAARIVIDDEGETQGLPRLLTCVSNNKSRELLSKSEEGDTTCLPIEADAIELILKAYPNSVRVGDVPLELSEDRIDLVCGLIEMGIIQQVSG